MSMAGYRRAFGILAFVLALAAPGVAPGADGRIQESTYGNLEFREIGPAIMGGRIDDLAVVESRPSVVYAGTASGGLWKTVNNGVTWESLFDREAVSSIGDVTVAPSDPNIVWVGTGEPNNRQSSSWGNGVYRTLDGGRTWAHLGLENTHHIGRIVVDPRDPGTAYVAAAGHLWGPNRERGLYKTTDGGKTWTNTLFINEDTGFIDVAMDPESSMTLYAAAYQRRRTPYGFNGGGPHSALYKTVDGGATWTRLTRGLPSGDMGRIGVDICRKDPRIVYAIVENAEGGVYRSEDRGQSWTRMSDTNPRPMYYSQIRVDPNNDQRIWVLGASMYASEDGGRTFSTRVVTRIHGDFHAMWINPADSNHVVLGSDGGIHFSWDRGRTWDFVNTIALGQFYEIGYDMRTPYWVYGGLQDNGSWGAPSNTLYDQGISNEDWIRVGGGDGFYTQVDPKDPETIYLESQNGNLQRLNLKRGERRNIRPEPPPGEPDYRFDWNSPILISPHDNRTIYYGGNRLFRSEDRGDSWTRSEDLTTQPDRDKMPIMGVVPGEETLSRHDGISSYGQILTVSESPLRRGLLWVGTDDGNIQVSRDGGRTFRNVSDRLKGVPKNTYVSRIVASAHAEGTAYATLDGHRNDDYRPYVYVTQDYGETWKSLAATLPAGHTVNVLREHPRNADLLFIGTEFGAFVSFDRGAAWLRMKNNLPTVPVDDIAIHPRENDLLLGTHGRSIWILDDISPLERLAEAVSSGELHVFDMRPAVMYRYYRHKGNTGHKFFTGPNPPEGAMIHYYLHSDVKDDVRVTILSGDGKAAVRELKGPKKAGIHRVVWDLRTSPPVEPEPGESRRFFRGPSGHRVEPGEYTVRVAAGSRSVSRKVRVEDDPRIEISAADRQKQHEALKALAGLYVSADAALDATRNLESQLQTLEESLQKKPAATDALKTAVREAREQVDQVQRGLVRTSRQESAGPPLPGTPDPVIRRVSRLYSAIDGYTAAPTAAQQEQIRALTNDIRTVVVMVNDLIEKTIGALNRQFREADIPHVDAGKKIRLP